MDGSHTVRSGWRSGRRGAFVGIVRAAAVATLVATAVLIVVAFAMTQTGRIGVVITHGRSMQPHYHQGDLVVVARDDHYRVGEIIAYRVPSRHLVVLHRLIARTSTEYTFKGDNNQSVDPWHPSSAQLIGHPVLHIPRGGIWLTRVVSPIAVTVGTTMLLLAGGTGLAARRRKGRNRRMAAHARRSDPRRPKTGSALPTGWRRTGPTTALVGVLGLALAAAAWTTPCSAEVTLSAVQERHMDFGYSARVHPSAASDIAVVRAPDPIFVKLADRVDVRFRYDGPRGALSVAAELSSMNGWHVRLPLVDRVSTDRASQLHTVTLDLPALEAKGRAAATATGMTDPELAVTLAPTVRTPGSAPFTGSLHLILTPLRLSLPGGAKALTVIGTTRITRHVSRQQQLRFLGHGVGVTAARTASLAAILASGLAALLLALADRGRRPPDTVTAVRRRHGMRVIEVAPVSCPAVVEVHRLDDLAEIARDLVLPMLHWCADGSDVFAVHDSTVLYLHRDADRTVPPPSPAAAARPPLRPTHAEESRS